MGGIVSTPRGVSNPFHWPEHGQALGRLMPGAGREADSGKLARGQDGVESGDPAVRGIAGFRGAVHPLRASGSLSQRGRNAGGRP